MGWGHHTIRKGLHELKSGIRCQDAFSARGRKAAEVHLPQLRADIFHLHIDLAYYPSYHSKYNPIERVWGLLEQHWNGHPLESKATVRETP